jgi:hypothetical protein
MACQVVAKGDTKYDGVVVNGYYEMTILDFIAERVNHYRKRAYHSDPSCENVYKIRVPSRPEPELNRKV